MHDLSRVAQHHRTVRNVSVHHRICADRHPFANMQARKNNCAGPKKTVVADGDFSANAHAGTEMYAITEPPFMAQNNMWLNDDVASHLAFCPDQTHGMDESACANAAIGH